MVLPTARCSIQGTVYGLMSAFAPKPEASAPKEPEKGGFFPRFSITFFLIFTAIIFCVFLVLKFVLVFEDQLGRQSAQVAIALILGFLLAPICGLVFFLRHPREGDPLGTLISSRAGYWAAGFVLLGGLTLSFFAGWAAERQAADADMTRFLRLTDRIHLEITKRLEKFTYGLRGTRGLWAARGKVTPNEFELMMKSRDLEREFQGATAVGFIQRGEKFPLRGFRHGVGNEEAVPFSFPGLPTKEDSLQVQYLFPSEPNPWVWLGFDIQTEPAILDTALASASRGQPMVTSPLKGKTKEGTEILGVIYFLPYFRTGLPTATPQNRLEAVEGWVFMTIHVEKALKGSDQAASGELDFEVYSSPEPSLGTLIYDDDNHLKKIPSLGWSLHSPDRSLSQSDSAVIGGQTWTITTSTRPTFQWSSRAGVWQLAGGGTLLSLLGAGLIFTLTNTTRRARAFAEKATGDLKTQIKLQERMALVVEQTKNLVIITDSQGCIEWVNPAFEQTTGYTLNEVKGRVPGHLLQCPKTDPQTVETMRAAIRNGHSCRVEVLNRSKLGKEYWLDIEIQPIGKDPVTGKVIGFLAVESDITDRKKAEEARSLAMERADLALASANMASWDLNVPTGQVVFDSRWAEMLGLRQSDLSDRIEEWSSRVHPSDLDEARSAMNSHFQGETPFYRSLHRLRHRNGTWLWILANGRVVTRDSSGRPTRFVCTQLDVTEDRKVQDELAKREKALTTTSRLAKVGWWELDALEMIPSWSDQVRALHEVGSDFFVTFETALFFYPGEARAKITECIQDAIARKIPFNVETPFRTAKGNSLWVKLQAEPVVENGRVVKLVGAIQDITDLVAAREKADAASRAKTDFLANMSHEIRTPMTAILGYTELLYEEANRDKAPRQRIEQIETIRRNGEHLLNIINDILDVSKIEAGKMTVEAIPTDPVQIVEDVVSLMSVRAKLKGIALERSYESSLPRLIQSDPLRLKQILVNLVGNAVKFTEQGRVFIRVQFDPISENQGWIRFEVQDTGVGMTPDKAAKLFRPFTQGDETMSRKFGGTGLGLAIAKRLAELLGGDITIQSTPGKGTTLIATVRTGTFDRTQMWKPNFQWREPITSTVLPVLGENGAPKPGGDLAGSRILLAEDGIDNQRLITFHLKKAGAEVVVAEDGARAVKALTVNHDLDSDVASPPLVDLILMDMQMPEMDGYAATRALRRLGCDLPIIGLTAHAMTGDREKCLQAGCDDYETKPIDRARLIQICREWLTKRRHSEPGPHARETSR